MPMCTPCGRSFIDKQAFRMHTESKHGAGRYECPHCDRTFKTAQGRNQHEGVKHARYECSYCDRTFKTSQGRDQHEDSKHTEYRCSYCDRTFKTSQGRSQHEESKHPKYECSYCDRIFETSQARDQHEDSQHTDVHECNHCDRTFTTSQGRDSHEKAKHVFSCDFCDQKFHSENALEQHDEAVHFTHDCTYCNKEFSSAQARVQHENAKHAGSNTVNSSSYHLRNLVPSSFGQSATAKPAPVEQPRIDELLDALSTQSSSPAPSDDYTEMSSDSHGDASYDDVSDTPSDDHDAVSFDYPGDTSSDDCSEASDTLQIASPEPVSNFGYGSFGEHFTMAIDPEVNEIYERTDSCVCKICERAGQPCSCGICRRTSTLTTPTDDEEFLVSNEPDETVILVDSPRVIEPKIVEDSSIEPSSSIELLEPTDPLTHELRNIAENTKVSQPEQTLRHVEHVVEASGLSPSRPTSPSGSENYGLDSSICRTPEMNSKEEGIVLSSYVASLEYSSALCEIQAQHVIDASVNVPLVMPSPEVDGCAYFSGHDIYGVNSKPQDCSVLPAEAWDGQQTIPDADTKHRLTNDHPTPFDPRVPGLEHDNTSSLHSTETFGSGMLSSVDSMLVLCKSPQRVRPRLCIAELGSLELDDHSTRDLVPSPTPSEQGSLHRSTSIIQEPYLDSGLPLSPSTSQGSADYFSDINASSTPSSPLSERSIVFVSAESIPEYLRENRAYLVATSAPSRPSSAASSYIRLPSVATSLDFMPPQEDPDIAETSLADSTPANGRSRLHCRICLQDPCKDLTATMCGHVFCNRCIVDAVVANSVCPVCNAPTLLYCLFRLDI